MRALSQALEPGQGFGRLAALQQHLRQTQGRLGVIGMLLDGGEIIVLGVLGTVEALVDPAAMQAGLRGVRPSFQPLIEAAQARDPARRCAGSHAQRFEDEDAVGMVPVERLEEELFGVRGRLAALEAEHGPFQQQIVGGAAEALARLQVPGGEIVQAGTAGRLSGPEVEADAVRLQSQTLGEMGARLVQLLGRQGLFGPAEVIRRAQRPPEGEGGQDDDAQQRQHREHAHAPAEPAPSIRRDRGGTDGGHFKSRLCVWVGSAVTVYFKPDVSALAYTSGIFTTLGAF